MSKKNIAPQFAHTGEDFFIDYYHLFTDVDFPLRAQRQAFYALVFALKNEIKCGDKLIPEGSFQMSGTTNASFECFPLNRGVTILLFIGINAKQGALQECQGIITPSLMRVVLDLLESQKQKVAINKWVSTKLKILVSELSAIKEDEKIHPIITFEEAEAINNTIEWAINKPELILTTDMVVQKSGMKKYRFQKGCRLLCGITLKDILYERQINRAAVMLQTEDKTAREISRLAGYKSHENFITGFNKYFSITPSVMQRSTTWE